MQWSTASGRSILPDGRKVDQAKLEKALQALDGLTTPYTHPQLIDAILDQELPDEDMTAAIEGVAGVDKTGKDPTEKDPAKNLLGLGGRPLDWTPGRPENPPKPEPKPKTGLARYMTLRRS